VLAVSTTAKRGTNTVKGSPFGACLLNFPIESLKMFAAHHLISSKTFHGPG
jgi:hypothetical protein